MHTVVFGKKKLGSRRMKRPSPHQVMSWIDEQVHSRDQLAKGVTEAIEAKGRERKARDVTGNPSRIRLGKTPAPQSHRSNL